VSPGGPPQGRRRCGVALPALPGRRRVCSEAAGQPACPRESARPGRIVGNAAPPDRPDYPEQLSRQLDDRLEAGVAVATALGLEGREARAATGGGRPWPNVSLRGNGENVQVEAKVLAEEGEVPGVLRHDRGPDLPGGERDQQVVPEGGSL